MVILSPSQQSLLKWFNEAKIDRRLRGPFIDALASVATIADSIVEEALKADPVWSAEMMIRSLRALKADVSALEILVKKIAETSEPPSSAVIIVPEKVAETKTGDLQKLSSPIESKVIAEVQQTPQADVAPKVDESSQGAGSSLGRPSPQPIKQPLIEPISAAEPKDSSGGAAVGGESSQITPGSTANRVVRPASTSSVATARPTGNKFSQMWNSVKSKLPGAGGGSSSSSRSVRRPSMSGGGNMGSISDVIKQRWQVIAIGAISLLFILSIAFLGPISGGQSQIQSTGSPINSVPVIAFFTILIMVPMFLEAWDRGDVFDAIFVLLSVFMSSTAVIYENKWSSLTTGTRPLGTYIVGFFFLAPYLIMIMSAVTNRTRNVFASRMFSKLDFSPVYMTLLIFWAMAKTHVYWTWVPNPCFFSETFYLNAGIFFLILELSGNLMNLGIAVAAGIASGLFMFNEKYFYLVFLIYMLVMGYASTNFATKEMTMNVDTAPGGPEGGTSFGRGVQSKRFVPYDLLAGALWFTAITVVISRGNPAFTLSLPF